MRRRCGRWRSWPRAWPLPADSGGAGPPAKSVGGGAPAAARWLPWVGLAVGVWAALPHFVSPPLDTEGSVEVVDHVVPGIVVVAVSLGALWARTRPDGGAGYGFLAGLLIGLAGLWMAATHVPLLAQASRGEAPWGAAIYHSLAAVAVLSFSVLWTAMYWQEGGGPPS